MKSFSNMKSNRAATMTDVVVAIMIMIMFTGILTTSFYRMFKHNISIRMNAIAVDYAIKILEDIDKISYEEVNNDLNDILNEKYNINSNYIVSLEVENYNKDDQNKEDIIKTISLTINYNVLNESKLYKVKKIKVKEM